METADPGKIIGACSVLADRRICNVSDDAPAMDTGHENGECGGRCGASVVDGTAVPS